MANNNGKSASGKGKNSDNSDEPKTLEQKLKDKDLYNIKDAAEILGYSEAHLRKLCAAKKVGHIKRGDSDYFLTRENIDAVFHSVKAKSA